MLVVDERNFKKILDHRTQVSSPDNFYNGFYSNKYMYCGSIIKGWPEKVDDNFVIFAYGYDQAHILGRLTMNPFKNGDLEELLIKVRFTHIMRYADFKLDTKQNTDADFFTYVARKPWS